LGTSRRKVEAIYELRKAAEKKALAERNLVENPTPQNRAKLLETQSALETKTMDAIDVCHECGHEHDAGSPHVG
jgi:hypothetical protein